MLIAINGAFLNKPGTIFYEHLVSLLPQAVKQAKGLEFIIFSPKPIVIPEFAKVKNIVSPAPTLSWWYHFVLPGSLAAAQPAFFYTLYDRRLPTVRISRICPYFIGLPYTIAPAKLKKRMLLKSSAIITASQYARSTYWQKLDIPLEHFSVLHNPLGRDYLNYNEQDLKKGKKTFLKSHGLNDYILWRDTYNAESNLESLLKGFADLGAAHRDVKLVLWQKRNLYFYSKIQPLIKQLSITNRITLLTLTPDESITRQLLYNARLLVSPCHSDRSQYLLLKTMALGTPLVSHNSLSLPELVNRGGILINTIYTNQLTSAMASILENKKLTQSLQQHQAKAIKRFAAKQVAWEFLQLLKNK